MRRAPITHRRPTPVRRALLGQTGPMDGLDGYSPSLLAGRTALVTGGGTGIGRAIALALADAGADVMLHGVSRARELDEAAAEAIGLIASRRAVPRCSRSRWRPDRRRPRARACLPRADRAARA